MIAILEIIGTVHTHTHTHTHVYFKNIKHGIFASFLNFKDNLISKVNRVNFVYMFVMQLRI